MRRARLLFRGHAYQPQGSMQDFTASFRHMQLEGRMGPQDGSIPPGMSSEDWETIQRMQQGAQGLGYDVNDPAFREATAKQYSRPDAFGAPTRARVQPKPDNFVYDGPPPAYATQKKDQIDLTYFIVLGFVMILVMLMSKFDRKGE